MNLKLKMSFTKGPNSSFPPNVIGQIAKKSKHPRNLNSYRCTIWTISPIRKFPMRSLSLGEQVNRAFWGTYSFQLDGTDARSVIEDIATGNVTHHLRSDILSSRQRTLCPSRNSLTHWTKTLTALTDSGVVLQGKEKTRHMIKIW